MKWFGYSAYPSQWGGGGYFTHSNYFFLPFCAYRWTHTFPCKQVYRQAKHTSKLSGDVIVRFLLKKYIYQLVSLCCYEKNNEKTPSPLSYNFLLLENNNIYLTVSEQKIICMAESLYIFSIFTCGVTNIK